MKRLFTFGMCLCCAVALAGCLGNEDKSRTTGRQVHHKEHRSANVAVAGPPLSPTAGRTGPLPDGGTASCVEAYSPAAISNRAFAFDGVVIDIGASASDRGDETDLGLPGVTFEVRQWFAGGSSNRVTVDLQALGDASTDIGPGDAYGLGSRLLVSGEPRWGGAPLDDPIAWGCGFSRYYDAVTAKSWSRATANQ